MIEEDVKQKKVEKGAIKSQRKQKETLRRK